MSVPLAQPVWKRWHGVSLLGAVEKVENKRSRGKKLMFFIKIIKSGQ